MWKTWANLLTLIRFASILPCAWSILQEDWLTAATLFALAVVTDYLDGPLARRHGHASPLGGLLDHTTDALFVSVNLGALAYLGYLPGWLPPLVALAFTQYLLDSRALAGRPLRASWLGRNNGIAYFVLLGIPLISNALDLGWPPRAWISAFGWVLVASTLLSMLDRASALLRTR
jgi:phosphatidylglycerophosphate synthase